MARLIYFIGIKFYTALLSIVALFHRKAALLVQGRKESLSRIRSLELGSKQPGSIWFHFASLGEFEQGQPVMEALRQQFPTRTVIVTFYSPSGYEIRKNTPLADHVFYLPSDTPGHASIVLEKFNPALALFTKYEYWPFYFREIRKKQIPLFMISAIFRSNQTFFKWYGSFFRNTLRNVTHFFVQNTSSLELLQSISLRNASLAGDTRFDRVISLPHSGNAYANIAAFVGDRPCLIAGSTWPLDEKHLAKLALEYADWTFIIAPHEIDETHLQEIETLFPDGVRYSTWNQATDKPPTQTLIIDNIGMLSTIYRYGSLAYIGGGFNPSGIHNTLEAATYGIPVIFGPHYEKFAEAKDLIVLGAGFSFSTAEELEKIMLELSDRRKRVAAGAFARRYVEDQAGATERVVAYLAKELSP